MLAINTLQSITHAIHRNAPETFQTHVFQANALQANTYIFMMHVLQESNLPVGSLGMNG